MNFNELSDSLPNGFHDAVLWRFEMDYKKRSLELHLDVWIGEMEKPKARETYRPALVTVSDVAYLIIEPPDPKNARPEAGGLRIDTGEGNPKQVTTKTPEAPKGSATTWVFLEELNRFLLFAGGEAALHWTGPEENLAK